MADIAGKVSSIRQSVYGKDVRESIASGIEAINGEVVSTTARQNVIDSQEQSRIDAEKTRVSQENTRISNETTRQNAETTRQNAEMIRQSTFTDSEATRATAFAIQEAARSNAFIDSETDRGNIFTTNESERQNTFENNEATRQSAETIRETNELNRQTSFDQMTHLDPSLELVEARGGRPVLNDRLVVMESDIHNINTTVGNVVSYVPTQAGQNEPTQQVNEYNFVQHIEDLETDVDAIGNTLVDNIPNKGYEGKKFIVNSPYRYGGTLSLKGQLHCHTTNSDGVDSPTALVTAYKNSGYNFMTITDHNFITPDPAVAGITWIGSSSEESQNRHVNVFGTTSRYTTLTNYQDILSYNSKDGYLTSLNHPNWNYDQNSVSKTLERTELLQLQDCNFIEIYNATTGTYADQLWDVLLTAGKKIFALAVDDCHTISGTSSLTGVNSFNKGWVMVSNNYSDKSGILSSLRNGNFYASNGNDLTITTSSSIISVTSTSNSNFKFIGRDGTVYQTNNNVTSASYQIRGDELYIRVESGRVSDNKYAWSQPIFIDTINGDESVYKYNSNNKVNKNILINGDFTINQRAVMPKTVTATAEYIIDRWRTAQGALGTLPTITQSAIATGFGELDGNYYGLRTTFSADMTNYTSGMNYLIDQPIEDGTIRYCGWGKKLTMSFYARSSIVGKKIAVNMVQEYGTGGSTSDNLTGKVFNLTPYWTKYECTFTTNSITGKTFGSNNVLRPRIWYAWDATTYGSRFGSSTNETFKGAGTIDIAYVKLEVGDKSTPFERRPYADELRDCQRYYEATVADFPFDGAYLNGSSPTCFWRFKTDKRTPITATVGHSTLGANKLYYSNGSTGGTIDVVSNAPSTDHIRVTLSTTGATLGAFTAYGYIKIDSEIY